MNGTVMELICCWHKLLYGKACVVYNILFSPLILCFWACNIYFCECLSVYFQRTFFLFCCCLCRMMNCCWQYKDKDFPPEASSLGDVGGDTANEGSGKSNANVIWLRANRFTFSGKMQLFSDSIDSRDICQGALGDCWLLAAMACLAEHKGAMNEVFISKERHPRGKYRIRLYDGVAEKWEIVTIDDYIPCNKTAYDADGSAKPLYGQPNGNELYAMLLEKAFAKFCGSYAKIEGGQTIWAIRAMTGDPARWFMQDDSKAHWSRYDLVNVADKEDRRKSGLKAHGEKLENETMFEVLRKYHGLRSVLCASGASGRSGLHTGHAYSILAVQKVDTSTFGMGGDVFRMVKIRNPWGTGEWKGDWADDSDLWTKHPKVKKALAFEASDDGAFWMSWKDFVENWSKIGVVDRTVDITALKLQIKDDSACAPTAAVVEVAVASGAFARAARTSTSRTTAPRTQ
eukprot:CAMPEP_0170625318 /NCGR_PEP_ID=MMETSP0224-20130122/30694_1 /TAXON_ID=285029 /ORGANISM="Togula jolla, Strain CCCM 725" /LENGTH=457 /DNA_ID=CAMNT_0010951883 /DNA_START=121 /DNA_END=1495 /DNA_ORIENTATION=-